MAIVITSLEALLLQDGRSSGDKIEKIFISSCVMFEKDVDGCFGLLRCH
jgi:hypothetical protein